MKELTDKQQIFVQEYTKDWNCEQAMLRAGYAPKYARHWNTKILAANGIKQAIDKIRADLAAECEFTREKQLKDLESAKKLAKGLEMPAAMVSATREQNEMLGYHRELAPNEEKERKRLARMDLETKRMAEIKADKRLSQVAEGDKVIESVLEGDSGVVRAADGI